MTTTQPDGYLALPDNGSGRPVLVLHAWWGLNDTIKALCDRLAEAGFVAFAPDLYHGRLADTIEGAKALSGALDEGRAWSDIAEAVAFLDQRSGRPGNDLAVLGFSMGAYFALALSNKDPEHVRSVVVFYGTGPDEFGRSQAAYLGHFAGNDPYEPLESVKSTEEALRRAGRPVTIHTYPGTGHWFFEPDRADAYDPAAAELAWERTLAFLRV